MKIKVCFVVLGLDFSGAENVLCDFINSDDLIIPQIVFIYKGKARAEFKKRLKKDIEMICLEEPYNKNELRFFPYLRESNICKRLKYLIKNNNIDIMYANNTLEVMLCKKAAKEINVSFVGHIHDMKNGFGTIFKIKGVKSSFKYYDELITVSKTCKKSWKNSRLKVIYNGIQPDFISSTIKPVKTIKKIGFIGMLNHRKGADLLYKVISCNPSQKYYVVYNTGEKKLEKKYKYVSKKINNIKLYNNLSKSQVKEFYNKIDLLVVPSRQDPLPTVILEAIGEGKLVIGSTAGGIPELLNEDKELIFSPNSSSLEHTIKKLEKCNAKYLQAKQFSLHKKGLQLFNANEKNKKINKILIELVKKN